MPRYVTLTIGERCASRWIRRFPAFTIGLGAQNG
jgi:hypothetical protein